MPEIISKYPNVTLKVLREAGAQCGQGLPQKILTKCPQDRFCALSTGEVCVLGVNELTRAQQVTPGAVFLQPLFLVPGILLTILVFVIGAAFGRRAMAKRS